MAATLVSATETTITVDLAGKTVTYPALHTQLGEHLAEDGGIGTLYAALRDDVADMKADPKLTSVTSWLSLDETDVVYLVEIFPTGRYVIRGGAHCPAP